MVRICSLLPGATEVVAALGSADDLVGISHECDHPVSVRRKPVMVRAMVDSDASTSPEIDRRVKELVSCGNPLYMLDERLFMSAQPDVVITQDLCQVCAVTPGQLQKALAELPKQPTMVSLNPTGIEDVMTDIIRIGFAIGREREAKSYVEDLRARLRLVTGPVATVTARPRVVCLEWLDPLYIAGHWVPEMVGLAGGHDVLRQAQAPSRRVCWQEIAEANPDVVVLMPCGFPLERTVTEFGQYLDAYNWQALPAGRNHSIFGVDAGAYFSRPGPRLVEGVALLASLCHPMLFPPTPVEAVARLDLSGAHHA